MNNYLTKLVSTALGKAPLIQPRLPSLFEVNATGVSPVEMEQEGKAATQAMPSPPRPSSSELNDTRISPVEVEAKGEAATEAMPSRRATPARDELTMPPKIGSPVAVSSTEMATHRDAGHLGYEDNDVESAGDQSISSRASFERPLLESQRRPAILARQLSEDLHAQRAPLLVPEPLPKEFPLPSKATITEETSAPIGSNARSHSTPFDVFSQRVSNQARKMEHHNALTLGPTRGARDVERKDAKLAAPVIRVSIGRIEVRAETPAPSVRPAYVAPAPKMSLDEYLRGAKR